MLDPNLTEENLEAIARNRAVLDPATLHELANHPAAWAELRAWAETCIDSGEITDIDEYVMPAEPAVAPLPAKHRHTKRWILGVGMCTALAIAGGAVASTQTGGAQPPKDGETVDVSPSATPSPVPTDVFDGLTASGDGFSCTAGQDTITCRGQNNRGQLGEGATPAHEVVIDFANVAVLSAGKDFVCASNGQGVTCWGDNRWRQAGNSDEEVLAPTQIPVLQDKEIDSLSAGEIHVCATSSGTVTCWGSDYSGQLGSGSQGPEASGPVEVVLPEGGEALTVVSSRFGACASTTDEKVLCWGANNDGRISDEEAAILPVTEVNNDE